MVYTTVYTVSTARRPAWALSRSATFGRARAPCRYAFMDFLVCGGSIYACEAPRGSLHNSQTMKNSAFAWIAGIIIVIGIIWYLAAGGPSAPALGTASTTASAASTTQSSTGGGTTTAGSGTSGSGRARGTAVPETVGVGSVSELMQAKQDLACAISFSSKGGTRTGTIYVTTGLMRGDFISSTSGSVKVVSMIDNGTSLYGWTNTSSQGIMLSAATSASGSTLSSWGAIDPAATFSYDCHPWTPDPDYFVAPSTKTYLPHA